MSLKNIDALIEDAKTGAAYEGSGKQAISYGDYLIALHEIKRLRKQIEDGPPYEPKHEKDSND